MHSKVQPDHQQCPGRLLMRGETSHATISVWQVEFHKGRHLHAAVTMLRGAAAASDVILREINIQKKLKQRSFL